MAYDINCPHCGYGYTPEELFKTNQLNKAGTFKANCRTLCKKDFEIEVVPSFNYFESKIEEAPMDLIEQLGGYECAKKHLDSCWCDDYNKVYLLGELLEYRRQHNTYEVGDHVVLINKPSSSNSLHRVLDVNKPTTIHICPINQVSGNDLGLLGFMASPFYLRHATNEEIKAGCRL